MCEPSIHSPLFLLKQPHFPGGCHLSSSVPPGWARGSSLTRRWFRNEHMAHTYQPVGLNSRISVGASGKQKLPFYVQLTCEQLRGAVLKGDNPPHSQKSKYSLQSSLHINGSSTSAIGDLRIQPASDPVVLQCFLWKQSLYKWTQAVQNHSVQGSTEEGGELRVYKEITNTEGKSWEIRFWWYCLRPWFQLCQRVDRYTHFPLLGTNEFLFWFA